MQRALGFVKNISKNMYLLSAFSFKLSAKNVGICFKLSALSFQLKT